MWPGTDAGSGPLRVSVNPVDRRFRLPTLFGYLKDTTGTTNGGLYTLSAAASLLAVLGVAFIRRTGGTSSRADEPARVKAATSETR